MECKKTIRIPKDVRVITVQEDESLPKYFRDIANIPLLTQEQEIQLSKEIKRGNEIALNTLVTANLRFVISVAKQYQAKGVPLSDLINEGNIGLIKAAQTFDETRGVRFISYAVFWIRQAILYALTEQSRMIHIPFNQHALLSKIRNLIEKNNKEQNSLPLSNEDIAKEIGVELEMVIDVMNTITGRAQSISTAFDSSDEGSNTLEDVIENPNSISPDSSLVEESKNIDIMNILKKLLSEQEVEILILYFGINQSRGLTCSEIGEMMCMTKECVRQIKEKALRRLRISSSVERLRMYF